MITTEDALNGKDYDYEPGDNDPPQPNKGARQLDEEVERLFTLRISSSGAMIDVGLPGHDEVLHVDYEVFLNLRKSIENLITQARQQAVAEFAEEVKAIFYNPKAAEDRVKYNRLVGRDGSACYICGVDIGKVNAFIDEALAQHREKQ